LIHFYKRSDLMNGSSEWVASEFSTAEF